MRKNDLIEMKKSPNSISSKIEEVSKSIVEAKLKLQRGELKNLKEVKMLRRTLSQLKTLQNQAKMEAK